MGFRIEKYSEQSGGENNHFDGLSHDEMVFRLICGGGRVRLDTVDAVLIGLHASSLARGWPTYSQVAHNARTESFWPPTRVALVWHIQTATLRSQVP